MQESILVGGGPRPDSIDRMLAGYVECALWSSNDESDESGGSPMDSNYDASDIAPDTLATMRAECDAFRTANLADLNGAEALPEQWGHDFWLTRNGHGAGFWDRPDSYYGPKETRDRLTDAAHNAGARDLYIGDDKRVHCAGG